MQKLGYHHGNLRQALVDAALVLIEAKGPTGFTLSEAAKNAGVTPAAVYRHFDGREDLIAEAALQGFGIFAERMEKPMRKASTVIFILVFTAIVIASTDKIVSGIQDVGIVTLLLNIVTMSLGYFTAKIFKLNKVDSISITIESGIQNGTLAIVIAASVLNNTEMAIPAGIYAIWMYVTGGALMWYFGRKKS